mmetsp:Transcript_20652/g.30370  ORF Transcript_20652/g.30370 Transcript_20652/m.30370 type:complete len:372 (-) Transcript_20652:142-1257(-)
MQQDLQHAGPFRQPLLQHCAELFVCFEVMQQQPTAHNVAVANGVHQFLGVVQDVLLHQHTFLQVRHQLLLAGVERLAVPHHQLFNILQRQRVLERLSRGTVPVPFLRQVDDPAHVHADDPVVVEMLVHDLSHRVEATIQNVGGKVEHDVQHGCLLGQGHGAVVRRRVDANHVVHVVGAQAVDDHGDNSLVDREALEVLFGVLAGGLLSGDVPSVAHQLGDLLDVVKGRLSFVPDVADHELLANRARNQTIHHQQHDAVQEQSLTHQLPPVGVQQHLLCGVGDEEAFPQIAEELVEVRDVLPNVFEQHVKALDDHHVVLLELVVDVQEIDGAVDRGFIVVGVLQVIEVEQHAEVAFGGGVRPAQEHLRDVGG